MQQRPTEHVCPDCGLVLEDSPIDHGPDWRSFEGDESDPERAAPGNRNHPDRGLGSRVRWTDYDADKRRRSRVNNHVRQESHKDRNRGYATGEIHRMTGGMDLPESVGERAKWLFRKLHEDRLKGQSLDVLAAACLYAACRERGMGRTPAEIAEVARCDAREIRRRVWTVAQTLGLELPPPDVGQRIRVVASRLSDDAMAVDRALRRLDGLDGNTITSGSPSTLAAALLYQSGEWTQTDVADAADVSPTGLRKRRDAL